MILGRLGGIELFDVIYYIYIVVKLRVVFDNFCFVVLVNVWVGLL